MKVTESASALSSFMQTKEGKPHISLCRMNFEPTYNGTKSIKCSWSPYWRHALALVAFQIDYNGNAARSLQLCVFEKWINKKGALMMATAFG